MRAFHGFENTPLSTHPWSYKWNVWHTEIYVMLLNERLSQEAELIKSFVYDGISEHQARLLDELGFLKSRSTNGFGGFSVDPSVFYSDVLKQIRREEIQKNREEKVR